MIDISREAAEKLKEMVKQENQAGKGIRIAIMGSMGLGVTVDSKKTDDLCFDRDGVPILIDKKLLDYCKSITITFIEGEAGCHSAAYIIKPETPL